MKQPKKLIEVAMPVKEISDESVRDINIKSGLSTMHLWWARRPLPVCRAVAFASLIPDPLDRYCPVQFKDTVELLLGKKNHIKDSDPYKPYDDIPWTSVYDPMKDNLRHRLMMFIGKFSPRYIENERIGKTTPVKDQLSDFSLIKWENKNNEKILIKARKLIWVAYNSRNGNSKNYEELLSDFDKYYNAIKLAEEVLYSIPDRHIETPEIKEKEEKLQQVIDAFLDHMPKVFDPFAGGGAIPLEAARLGCRSYGNDLNPVAHIVQKGSVEFPQKYGKPIKYTKDNFIEKYGKEKFDSIDPSWFEYIDGDVAHINVPNRLSFDVEFYAKELLKKAETKIGHFYPSDEKGNKPIAYYWARVATCTNPSCQAKVPLLRNFNLSSKNNKKIQLFPIIKENKISFDILNGESKVQGWINRGNLVCPCCNNITDVKKLKEQFINNETSEIILAEIWDSKIGKTYKIPANSNLNIKKQNNIYLYEPMPVKYTQAFPCCTWGISNWGEMFNERQIIVLRNLVEIINDKSFIGFQNEYSNSIKTYLGILIDKIASFNSKFSIWDSKTELLKNLFLRQAISFVFDYPEPQIFSSSTGGGYAQIKYIVNSIEQESSFWNYSILLQKESGDIFQFSEKEIFSTITDPPYYDAISYADLSDFFYVWLKRSLGEVYPNIFATPLSPKSDECTALKHRFLNNKDLADRHFEDKLSNIVRIIEKQTSEIISIMFAHQSTKAWATICNSILVNQLNITSSWSVDTELTNTIKKNKAFLSSSITLTCKPTVKESLGNFQNIKLDIENKVKSEVKLLQELGFRGADLLTACFGQAVSVFGQYEKVEKADGREVTVAELLEMARDAAFNTIISNIHADEVTRFYIGWLNLFGFTQAEHDDVRRITQIGLSLDTGELLAHHILIQEGNKESLADFNFRIDENEKLGMNADDYEIDKAHQMMNLFNKGNRSNLLKHVARMAPSTDSSLWRVLNSLYEVLPAGCDDHKQVAGLLTNKESLIRDAKGMIQPEGTQAELEL